MKVYNTKEVQKIQDFTLIENILDTAEDSIIAIDLNGKILFWNRSSEKLFGYKSKDILGKDIPFITENSKFELEYIIEKTKSKVQTRFRTEKKNKKQEPIDLIFTTNPIINKKNEIIGTSITIQKTELHKKISYLPIYYNQGQREQKRTFIQIRNRILSTLNKEKTINQISNDSGINWRTVEKHLTYFMGKKLVKEIFSSEYVRIFELTDLGKLELKKIRKEEIEKIMK